MDRQKKDAYYKYLCYVLSKSELALRSKSPLKARIVPEYLKPLNLGLFFFYGSLLFPLKTDINPTFDLHFCIFVVSI